MKFRRTCSAVSHQSQNQSAGSVGSFFFSAQGRKTLNVERSRALGGQQLILEDAADECLFRHLPLVGLVVQSDELPRVGDVVEFVDRAGPKLLEGPRLSRLRPFGVLLLNEDGGMGVAGRRQVLGVGVQRRRRVPVDQLAEDLAGELPRRPVGGETSSPRRTGPSPAGRAASV